MIELSQQENPNIIAGGPVGYKMTDFDKKMIERAIKKVENVKPEIALALFQKNNIECLTHPDAMNDYQKVQFASNIISAISMFEE